MTGGLIQLITIGRQDTPLISNPEITFFKNVYRQHTQFSISNNERYLDTKAFDTVGSKNIEKNGDLLLNMAFKLEIPYFEIIKNIKTTKIIKEAYNLNSLDVNYLNTNCIVFFEKNENKWIIIPENLFKLSKFEGIYYDINVNDLQKNLLPEYIKLIDLGDNIKLYQIQDNPISPIISLLRVNSNYWEQLLLNYMSETKDTDLLNKLYTVSCTLFSLRFCRHKLTVFASFRLLSGKAVVLHLERQFQRARRNKQYDTNSSNQPAGLHHLKSFTIYRISIYDIMRM